MLPVLKISLIKKLLPQSIWEREVKEKQEGREENTRTRIAFDDKGNPLLQSVELEEFRMNWTIHGESSGIQATHSC